MNKWITTLYSHGRQLLLRPSHELSEWQRAARFAIDLARHCARRVRRDRTKQMAAALTYHTLFSLLPTIVLSMVVFNAFVGTEAREEFKDWVVRWSLREVFEDNAAASAEQPIERPADEADGAEPDAVTPVDTAAAAAAGPDAEPQPAPDAASERRRQLQETSASIAARIEQLMDSVSQINFAGIGIVGLLLFIYGATALLTTIEQTFNSIFGQQRGRPWHVRFPLYFTVITLSPVLLVLGQFVQSSLFGALEGGWLLKPLGFVTPLILTWALLYLLYTLMPTANVGKRYAAIGSLVAAIGWVAAKELFRWYVKHAAAATFYGALGLLPLFLLWVYLTWLITLFGLEIAASLRSLAAEGHVPLDEEADEGPRFMDPRWAVPICAQLASAFADGRVATADALARDNGLPRDAIDRLLDALDHASLVHRVANDDEPAYALAQPADRIHLDRIIAATESLTAMHDTGDTTPARGWEAVRELRAAQREFAAETTLADLVAQSRSDDPAGSDETYGGADRPRHRPAANA